MTSEIGGNAAGNEDDLTALEKFGNKFYNGVCGVLCVSAHLFLFTAPVGVRPASPYFYYIFLMSVLKIDLLCTRFVMSKETAGSSITVMGGMIIDFLQSARFISCYFSPIYSVAFPRHHPHSAPSLQCQRHSVALALALGSASGSRGSQTLPVQWLPLARHCTGSDVGAFEVRKAFFLTADCY